MPTPLSTRVKRLATVALAGAFCLTAGASAASAADLDTSVLTTTASGINILETPETRESCTAPQFVSAFASFGDTRDYVLAPGGSFEDKTLHGWQVQKANTDGQGSPLEILSDNERSLKVPPGGSATSPAMCVDLNYPTLRLMAQAKDGRGQLKVEVIYPDSANPTFQTIGGLGAGGREWEASDDMPVYPEWGGDAPGMRRIALRFTTLAVDGVAGDWRIDDVYVDPLRR
jgi:hypothetical protein